MHNYASTELHELYYTIHIEIRPPVVEDFPVTEVPQLSTSLEYDEYVSSVCNMVL